MDWEDLRLQWAALVSPWQDYVCLKERDIANRKRHLESSRIAKADRDR